MKLLRGLKPIAELNAGSVAAIGNFDGVHRGHQALLRQLRTRATQLQLPLLVVLFEPQPSEFFLKKKAPGRIYRLREKLHVLRECGVDFVYCLTFNEHIAAMSAEAFANRYIFSLFNIHYLLIGNDFRFGHDRLGNAALLQEMGREHACTVETYPDYPVDSERVSSTKIRQALLRGDLEAVAQLLGRTYSMSGRVIHGQALGRQWGVPTANLKVDRQTLSLCGIFCVQVQRPGKPLCCGVASLGYRPTIKDPKSVLEVYLFGVDESFYGEMIHVFFLHKLRDEVNFPSMDALIEQIYADVDAAKAYFHIS